MKKLVSIVLVLTMLTGLLGMLSGCGGPKGTVEEGATVVTLYAQNFEQWNN